MLKKIGALLLILACLVLPSPAFAYGGHGGGHGGWHGGGHGWGHGGWGWGWGAVGLVETAALLNAAYRYSPYYYVNGVPYYYENPYYVAAPVGYVGVAQPPLAYVPASTSMAAPYATPSAASSQPPAAASVSDSFDIHIPNGNGSFTLITLQKTEKGFLGPQGEFYTDHPTEDQLRARYIKK
jgi:hypothetical protein